MPQGTDPLSPLPSGGPPTVVPDYVTGKVNWSRFIPTFIPAYALVPRLFPTAPHGEQKPPSVLRSLPNSATPCGVGAPKVWYSAG